MRQDHPVFNLGSQAEADAIVAWVARKLRDPNAARCHSTHTERPAKICVTCHDETE
jgi:hypothetical protein